MYPGRDTKRFILLRKGGTDNWMIYNYTPSEETKVYEDVPSYKKSYKTIDADRLKLDTSRTEEVFAPKLDGAHNLVVLRPNKRPDVFSYRSSRKGSERIDHTFKTPLYKQTSPKELGNTILRSELFVPGGKGNDTARILNSSVPKAREIQQKERPLEFKIFDVVKFKGKDVEDLPYSRKLEMLKEVRDKIPDLKLPELAFDPHDKRQMFNRIMKGFHPETEEGLVVYKLDEPVPRKVKQTDDYDAEILGTFEASEGSKYEGSGVGGFIALPEGSSVPIRIGTGLSDDLRQKAYESPDNFIGEWAKIKSQHVHSSGLHQAPVLVDIRPEKFMNKAAMIDYLIEKRAGYFEDIAGIKDLDAHKKYVANYRKIEEGNRKADKELNKLQDKDPTLSPSVVEKTKDYSKRKENVTVGAGLGGALGGAAGLISDTKRLPG